MFSLEALHEAGHAVVASMIESPFIIEKAEIRERGNGGFVDLKGHFSLQSKVCVSLAGHIAVYLFFDLLFDDWRDLYFSDDADLDRSLLSRDDAAGMGYQDDFDTARLMCLELGENFDQVKDHYFLKVAEVLKSETGMLATLLIAGELDRCKTLDPHEISFLMEIAGGDESASETLQYYRNVALPRRSPHPKEEVYL